MSTTQKMWACFQWVMNKPYINRPGRLPFRNYSGFEIAEDEAERRAEEYEDAQKWYLDIFGGIEADRLTPAQRTFREMIETDAATVRGR